jgi:hypothetical protein
MAPARLISRAPLQLYPFRYRDPRTGKWVRARYVAELHEIAERDAEWKITGAAEIRTRGGGSFNPYRTVTHAELMRMEDPPLQTPVSGAQAAARRTIVANRICKRIAICAAAHSAPWTTKAG